MNTATLAPIVLAPAESSPVMGVRLVPATFCMYPPAIHPADLLRVDFDQKTIGPAGLYLIEILNDAGVEWRGCRRFLSAPQAGLQMDQSGEGDWVQVSAAWRLQTRVVGYVEEIYRPTLRAPSPQALAAS